MIRIQSNIPAPPAKRGGRKPKYPWASMRVGDSFFVQGKSRDQIATTAYSAGTRYGYKFTVAEVQNGVRIWRTA